MFVVFPCARMPVATDNVGPQILLWRRALHVLSYFLGSSAIMPKVLTARILMTSDLLDAVLMGVENCGKSIKTVSSTTYKCTEKLFSYSMKLYLRLESAQKRIFQQALSSGQVIFNIHYHRADHPPSNSQPTLKAKAKKMHLCPHPDCPNQYKQLSGLRYHLAHVRISHLFLRSISEYSM